MTREEFDKLYLGKAIHCDTEEKANHFLALADSVGYKWINSLELINFSRWEGFKEETCYEVTEYGLIYDNIALFKCTKHEIIEYVPQSKLKVGDKVRVNSTIFETLNGEVGVIVDTDPLSPLTYCVKVGPDAWALWFYENQLEKVEEQICKEETIDDIIEEIKENQKRTAVLLNRLEQELKTNERY